MIATALVFGASGFIGRWVARELEQRGASVVGAARNVQAAQEVFDRWEIGGSIEPVDLTTRGSAAALIDRVRPAVVFNLAGYGVDRSERDAAQFAQLNTSVVAEIGEACAPTSDWPGADLVHVGSALEYGTESGMLDEHGPASPTTDYGRTKLAGTLALMDIARLQGTRALTARLFTVFGDGEHEGRLFPSLLRAAREQRLLPLTDGQQRRDFAWVGDVVNVLVDLVHAPFTPGEVVNVATGHMHSVEQFIRAVASQVHIPEAHLQFGVVPTRPEEMTHAGVSVRRLKELLGEALPADLHASIASAVRDERLRRAV